MSLKNQLNQLYQISEAQQRAQHGIDDFFDARRDESRVLVIGFCLTRPNSPRAFSRNLYAIDY